MSYSIEGEIGRFDILARSLSTAGFKVDKLADFAYGFSPNVDIPRNSSSLNSKKHALTFLGLIHGNEWGGVAVINEVLAFLHTGSFKLKIPLAFALGNPWAAKENRRFRESDLNRSFACKRPKTLEQLRADTLAPVLADSAYLVDFHQTRQKSEQPFFIFPYTRSAFDFARSICLHSPIVTHWGKPFSLDGMCTDEFVNSQGGVGITIELGQNGFDAYQIAAGFKSSMHAIQSASDLLTESAVPKLNLADGEIYTWAKVYGYPEGDVVLEPGWENFKEVKTGQKIGSINGESILSDHDGRILFASYPRNDVSTKPAELCRVIRKIKLTDLPKS